MRTVAAHTLFQGAMGLLTGQGSSAGVPTSRFAAIRGYLDRALQRLWEAEHWPDLVRLEARRYRDDWASGTTYSASTSTAAVEVFFPATQLYYQSLQGSNTNHAPATQSGTTWTENSAWWAQSRTSYSGNDWVTGTVYVAGNIVRRTSGTSADYRWYQCHTGHTAGASFDATKFCVLTEFDAYIGFTQTGQTAIGEVFNITAENPRVVRGLTEYKFWLSSNGVQLVSAPVEVWLEFRKRRPELTGDVWSSTATYTAGQQVYYTTSAGVGNFYDCVTATSAGESPVSAAAKWSVVEIPYIFGAAMTWHAYADLLAADGQADKAMVARTSAEEYYSMEADKLYRQQRQTQPHRYVGY